MANLGAQKKGTGKAVQSKKNGTPDPKNQPSVQFGYDFDPRDNKPFGFIAKDTDRGLIRGAAK